MISEPLFLLSIITRYFMTLKQATTDLENCFELLNENNHSLPDIRQAKIVLQEFIDAAYADFESKLIARQILDAAKIIYKSYVYELACRATVNFLNAVVSHLTFCIEELELSGNAASRDCEAIKLDDPMEH